MTCTSPLFILGSGLHSNVVSEVALDTGYKSIRQVDVMGDCHSKLIAFFSELDLSSDFSLHIALGHNFLRHSIYSFLYDRQLHHHLVSIIHPSSYISSTSSVHPGTYIGPGVHIGFSSQIGICNVLCTGSIVEHDCKLGDFCSTGPAAVLCGSVEVGSCSFLGASSSFKQGVRIGSNSVIGLNSTVLSNIPDYVTAFGNPVNTLKSRSFSTPYL